ncbi:uncharacterized protein LOC128396579 isoform X2 [Panonychus citri]|uniref:uncharacterized protein LOC128396579 isoform X2 n=1 Tax=Panonychus citri TaxID=50023 RepID=UPI00230744F0|nr:uncharacterized protein LOC128396579 isoform X2 [Panonychus citri]
MKPNDSYENLAIIIVLSGCGTAILAAILVLICCHLFVKSKETVTRSRYYTSSGRTYTLERQTTSSDDNNMELFSCCIEESISQQPDAEESDEDKTVSPRSLSISGGNGNGKAQNSNEKTNNIELNNFPQVRFCTNQNGGLVETDKSERIDEINKPLNSSHRRSSGGITRQQSFEVPDEEINIDLTNTIAHEEENTDERSPETIRREYRELWQLRATLELEENQSTNPIDGQSSSTTIPDNMEMTNQPDSVDLVNPNLTKSSTKYESGWFSADSGYRSMERRDYSIDSKTESIYRSFISNSGPSKKSHHSIQEEQESEAFV